MSGISVGYALQVKQRDTGKTGYLYGNSFGAPKYSYLTLVENPSAFLANPPDHVLAALKRNNLEIERLVNVKAVVAEKTLTRQDCERYRKLDAAVGTLYKQTVRDVMGEEAVNLIRDEIREGTNLQKQFARAVANEMEFDGLEYIGTAILGPQGQIMLGKDSHTRSSLPIEINLADAVANKNFSGAYLQDENLMHVAEKLFADDKTKADVKLGGVYIKICEDDNRNWNPKQIAWHLQKLAEKTGTIAASLPPAAPPAPK